ncbi:flavin reductase family protein [Winogradskyella jejuensis]|uniref:NADH-FMN oxidoreductase RutF, flavin reductase (DIM6/NTAB) family n=1 Tax=Winogradskyella jejuensis TaxID=1089305 RepID=A0A1M5V1W1_9FLAO|nr:flavin reductase [Winogradskyella jejuensis]SHH69252.1 NADH-FMN oxidoreductase RutF, flavin reductase (DIM6/NTAB) family [Winogradskyella jejuensis]
MAEFSLEDINKMHHLYRINLINSCSGYKSANLIGTKDADGNSNLAVFSSLTHMGSNPGLLGVFMRPTTVIRHTYENLKNTGYYTVNHIHEQIITDAHHTSAKYDKSVSEFDVTELQEEYKDHFHAPFVAGCPIQIAMSFVEEYHIKANNTILVVGKIEKLYVPDELIEKDGFINLSKGKVVTINGLDGYAVPDLKTRLEYQRPKAGFAHRD